MATIMFSVEDFETKYIQYPDAALYEIYSNPDDYSTEAITAATNVISKRGGLEAVKAAAVNEESWLQETSRIEKETARLAVPGVDLAFLQGLIRSDILTKDDANDVIAKAYSEIRKIREDEKIKPRTVYGSIIGGIVSGIIGGILLGILMLQGYAVLYIFLAVLFFLNYFIIRAITKQTSRNTFVLVSSILSVVLALGVGMLIWARVMASVFSD